MKGMTIRVLWALAALGVLSCGKEPTGFREGKEPLTDFLTKELRGNYERGMKPCPGCRPDYYLEVIEGLKLHGKGKWERSNQVLLKAYREDADQTAAVVYFISLNYGMLGSYPESKQWGQKALSFHPPASWIEAVVGDPLYGDLFKKHQMRWLPYWLERNKPAP